MTALFADDRLAPDFGPPDRTLPPGLASLLGRFDHVTKLPNRLQFIDDFGALAQPSGKRLLVMVTLAEARHYNEILRALGHAFAEQFVQAGAAALAQLLPAGAAIYHVSVLSFAFVLDREADGGVPNLVREVVRLYADPLGVADIPIKTKVGVGLLAIDTATNPPEALRASLAAAQDSRRGEDGWSWYNHKSDEAHRRAFRLLYDLPAAIAANDQLSLAFQPRLALATGKAVGAEALLRWRHPELGPISPAEFIPLAEQTALIGPLTDWVFEAALGEAGALAKRGTPLRVSVNASPLNIAELGFDTRLLELCAERRIDTGLIEVEFTEGSLSSNFDRTVIQLNRLRDAGIEVAIDDFGSGFANLSYLARLPADVLKIDQSFIRPLGSAGGSEFLVSQIVAMARGLDFRVCAEGIETADTYARLKALGCDEGQGYYMARPMPAEALHGWLDAGS